MQRVLRRMYHFQIYHKEDGTKINVFARLFAAQEGDDDVFAKVTSSKATAPLAPCTDNMWADFSSF